ncbi:unnamed protein product [Symbiodinium sp. CCMP2592]|nr:unnamed protein product [Symbiodinium sp. CCMP2592]
MFEILTDPRLEAALPTTPQCYWSRNDLAWGEVCPSDSPSKTEGDNFRFPSLRMGGREVETDVLSPSVKQGSFEGSLPRSSDAALYSFGVQDPGRAFLQPSRSSFHSLPHSLPLRVCFAPSWRTHCNHWCRGFSPIQPPSCPLSQHVRAVPSTATSPLPAAGALCPTSDFTEVCSTMSDTASGHEVCVHPLRSEEPAWLSAKPFVTVRRHDLPHADIIRPPDSEDRERRTPPPSSRAPAVRHPGNIALLRATHVKVLPAEVRAAPVYQGPIGAFTWTGSENQAPGTYTVFDTVRDYTIERAPAHSSLHEVVALAMSACPFTVGAVQVLMVTVPGLPCPQLVLQATAQPPTDRPIPWDCRAIGEGVYTLRHHVGQSRTDAIGALNRRIRAPRNLVDEHERGLLQTTDAAGALPPIFPQDLEVMQHVRVQPGPQQFPLGLHLPRPVGDTGVIDIGDTTGRPRVYVSPPLQATLRLIIIRGTTQFSAEVPAGCQQIDSILQQLLEQHHAHLALPDTFTIVLARALPLRAGFFQEVIFVLREDSRVVCVWDSRHLGQRLQTSELSPQQSTHDILPEQWRNLGWRLFVNGAPEAAALRQVQAGDYLQPCTSQACPGVVPLASVLASWPELRPYAWEMSVGLDRWQLYAASRTRRIQLGSHRMPEGLARLYGPHHGEVFLNLATHVTPTSQQVEDAVLGLSDFPRNLRFRRTPHAGYHGATFVSAYRHRLASTVLSPAPGHPGHFIVLMVHPSVNVISGIPAAARTSLFPQSGLSHGDVLVSVLDPQMLPDIDSDEDRHFLSASSKFAAASTEVKQRCYEAANKWGLLEPEPCVGGLPLRVKQFLDCRDDTSEAPATCTHFLEPNVVEMPEPIALASCEQHAPARLLTPAGTVQEGARPPSTNQGNAALGSATSPSRAPMAGTQPTSMGIPTPFGRRRLPSCSHEPEPDGPPKRQTVLLAPALAEPDFSQEHRLSLAVSTEVKDFAYQPFTVPNLHKVVDESAMHPAAQRLLSGLRPLQDHVTGDAAMLFTDGSFDPVAGTGAWAVAVLVRSQQDWHWGGFLAGALGADLRQLVHSAYDAELFAQLVAHLICLANPWSEAAIIFDAQAAAEVTQGTAASASFGALPRAALAARLCTIVQGREPVLQHVHSHTGHPGNELADSLATCAARSDLNSTELNMHLRHLVADPALQWLWLVQAPMGCGWPRLDEHGIICPASLPCATEGFRAPSDWTPPTVDLQGPARDLKIKLCTCNTLSARTSLQRHSLQAYLRTHRLDVLFLQETREGAEPCRTVDHVWRFSSHADKGQLGCQIWVDTKFQPAAWDTTSFAVVFSHPRLLLVKAKLLGQPVILISGHARTSTASDSEINDWWDLLERALATAPRGHIPLIGIDANAHWHGSTPTNANACHMDALLQRRGLASSGTTDMHGRPIVTWRSPQGHELCLDFVLLPREWMPQASNIGVVPILDQFAGIDHEPLVITVAGQLPSSSTSGAHRLDIEKMHTPEGKRVIESIFRSAPRPAWEVDVDEHLFALNSHFQQQLQHAFTRPKARPRNPVISADTWALLLQKRFLRRQRHGSRQQRLRRLLHFCLQTWAGGRSTAACALNATGVWRDIAKEVIQGCMHHVRLRRLAKQIRRSANADEAAFTRRTFQDAAAEGPSRKAHLIRAVLKSGRRYRPCRLSVALRIGDTITTDQDEVTQAFGQHFARAEKASTVRFSTLAQEGASLPTPQTLEATGLPSIADLAHGFACLRTRKAPGLSGLSGDFYRAAPALAACAHYPLILKMASRNRAPLLWTGSKYVPIPKPLKDSLTVQGYRAIALLESSAKAFGKAIRRPLLESFETIVQPGTAGARRGFPLELPALTGQAFLDFLHARQHSGALLYVDGVSAFYATNRQVLGMGSDQERRDWITSLPVDQAIKEAYLSIVGGQSSLERAQVDEMIQRLVRSGFCPTWFTVQPADGFVFQTQAGTVPGAPLADLLFQFAAAPAYQTLQQCLQQEGLAVSLEGVASHALTWLDDFAVPMLSPTAHALPARLARVAALTSQALATTGVAMNFEPGKSEAVVCMCGQGSQQARQELFVAKRGRISVSLQPGEQVELVCTPRYTHLGSVRSPECNALPDIRRRRTLAADVCTKVCRRLLRNPALEMAEKRTYLFSLVLSKFMHGLATWAMTTKKEQTAYQAAYMSLLRPAVRPLLSFPCWRLTHEQTCAVLHAMTPDEALHCHRVRIIAQVAAKGTPFMRALLHASGLWLNQAWQAVSWLVSLDLSSSLRVWVQSHDKSELLQAWPLSCVETTALLRRARRLCIKQRESMIPGSVRKARAFHKAEQAGLLHFRCHIGQDTQQCHRCGARCASKAALAAHVRKVHGVAAPQRVAMGTACLCCGKEFWATSRLREHFRTATTCRTVYEHADLNALPDEQIGTPQHPVVPFIGPRPFWATLRPANAIAVNPPPPSTHAAWFSAFLSITELAGLPMFCQRWLEAVSCVDLGELRNSWHRMQGCVSNQVQRFALAWSQFCMDVQSPSFFEAEGISYMQREGRAMIADSATMHALQCDFPDV